MSSTITKTSATVNLYGDDKELRVVNNKRTYNFSMIGRLKMLESQFEEKDCLEAMGTMSKPVMNLFLEIKRKMHWQTNMSKLDPPNGNTEMSSRSRAYSKLRKMDIVRRVGVRMYMVNPEYIVPGSKYIGGIVENWNNLK